MNAIDASRERPSGAGGQLAPLLAVVFVGFLVTGLALPVLPLYVHQGLGFGTFFVGLVTGASSLPRCSHACGQAVSPTHAARSGP